MSISIRQEHPDDHASVAQVIESSYENVAHSNHQEQCMVERLRNSDAFIPELSLVAETDGEIVGYLMLTKIFIHRATASIASLALGPLAVVPEFQGKGVGSSLVIESHRIAKELGYASVIVLGPGGYYSRFGYEPTTKYALTMPFDVREENCKIICFHEQRSSELTGRVEYHPSWWIK